MERKQVLALSTTKKRQARYRIKRPTNEDFNMFKNFDSTMIFIDRGVLLMRWFGECLEYEGEGVLSDQRIRVGGFGKVIRKRSG